MKFLFDQNLSHKLCHKLNDLFPDSTQARLIGLDHANDASLWDHAKSGNFLIVTLDSDFAELNGIRGFPPKVILLRCGNQSTNYIEALLRKHALLIEQFASDTSTGLLMIF